jgi:hypothetical protein
LFSESKLKRLQEDPSSPVFQQELYQLIKDHAAAVEEADPEHDAAENGDEFELEDQVKKVRERCDFARKKKKKSSSFLPSFLPSFFAGIP